MKTWNPDHLRLANAASLVSRKLRNLANVIFEREPVLARLLVDQAMVLRRSFRPVRKIEPRDRRAA